MALGANIRKRRLQLNMTLEKVQELSGVDVGTINALENRDSGRSSYAADIARALQTTVEALSSGAGQPQEINLDANPDYPSIRRVTFRLSAGISGFAIDVIDDPASPIVFRRDWYESRHLKPDKLFAVRVINGSMEPKLRDGDLVVVNTEATEPKDGEVFAVNYEGEMLIKRLVRDEGQWWLSSDNPDKARYPRKLCHEKTFLIGQVVYMSSERI